MALISPGSSIVASVVVDDDAVAFPVITIDVNNSPIAPNNKNTMFVPSMVCGIFVLKVN
jgi:hypothetical protein